MVVQNQILILMKRIHLLPRSIKYIRANISILKMVMARLQEIFNTIRMLHLPLLTNLSIKDLIVNLQVLLLKIIVRLMKTIKMLLRDMMNMLISLSRLNLRIKHLIILVNLNLMVTLLETLAIKVVIHNSSKQMLNLHSLISPLDLIQLNALD